MELKDKVALITGGAQGIGRTISEELTRAGAHVVLGDVNLEGARATAEAINKDGGSASAVKIDVSNANEVKEVFDFIVKDIKPVDIVVNNAGITRDGLMVRMKESDWDLVLDINLKGCFLCSQQAAKQMMKQKSGAIVNISSIVGVMGNFGQANYSASKAGVIGLTKTLAREVASRGIRVNAIAPGFIDTDFISDLPDEQKDAYKKQVPLKRFGSSQDVATPVLFLASKESSYITGSVLEVTGGL